MLMCAVHTTANGTNSAAQPPASSRRRPPEPQPPQALRSPPPLDNHPQAQSNLGAGTWRVQSPTIFVVRAQVATLGALRYEPSVLAPWLTFTSVVLVLGAPVGFAPNSLVLARVDILHETISAAPATMDVHVILVDLRSNIRIASAAISLLGPFRALLVVVLVLTLALPATVGAIRLHETHEVFLFLCAISTPFPCLAMLAQVCTEVVRASVPTVNGDDVALRKPTFVPKLAISKDVLLLESDGPMRRGAVVHDGGHVVRHIRGYIPVIIKLCELPLP